jgi:hypothetical protein
MSDKELTQPPNDIIPCEEEKFQELKTRTDEHYLRYSREVEDADRYELPRPRWEDPLD